MVYISSAPRLSTFQEVRAQKISTQCSLLMAMALGSIVQRACLYASAVAL
jgi:hypothetical protein